MTMRFKVLTYNMHKGISADSRRCVLAGMQKALTATGADVLVLQEIVDKHDRYARKFVDWVHMPQFHFLAENQWDQVVFGENAVHRHGSHGNAVLSNFPVHRWRNVDVTRNRLEQRGVLHVEIEIPKLPQSLHLCGVHLNLLGRDRKKQLEAIENHLERTVPEGSPLIIAGDFNDWRKNASEQLFNGVGVEESHKQIHGRYARTFPAWNPLLSLDRIYYRNLQLKTAKVLTGSPWKALSDHLPIVTEFSGK